MQVNEWLVNSSAAAAPLLHGGGALTSALMRMTSQSSSPARCFSDQLFALVSLVFFFLFHVELCASLSITPVSGEMFLYFCPPAASGWHGDALNGQGSAEMSCSRTREVVEKSYRR